MAAASANESVCASTGASPATAPVGTGESAPNPQPPAALALKETTTVAGGGRAANVVITEEETGVDGTCSAGVEPSTKRQKKTTSKVWDFYTKLTVTHKRDDGTTEVQVWAKCKKCSYKTRGESNKGTTVLWNHVNAKHDVKKGQQQLKVEKSEGKDIIETYKYDPEVSLKKFYQAIVMHEYPFVMAEHEFFVDFIKSLRPNFSFKSRITTRKEILDMHLAQKKKLFDQLKTISCRFSATMDMWTSNQNKGYMCITIHWIDDNWQMQKRIICLPFVKGQHKGTVLASEFIKGIMSWNLEKRLFALTLDNASNNNKCVISVVKELNKLAKLQKYPPLICGGIFFHVRCLCHILNLVAQNGLTVIGSAVKNIRAIIVILKNSPLQWEEFEKCADFFNLNNKSGLPLDVPTRWNSTYEMLSHAIYYRNAFDRLVYLHKDKYKHCAPSDDEWEMAASFCKCLKLFNDATVLFSGTQYPTANMFWWKFCDIKLAITEWCASADILIASMAQAMQEKYDKYWKKSNIALAVACFLDPRYKKRLIEYFLQRIYKDRAPAELSLIMDVVKRLFEAYLSSIPSQTSKASAQSEPIVAPAHTSEENTDIEEFLYEDEVNRSEVSELDVCMAEKPFRWVDPSGSGAAFDILSWWKTNQAKYPILSRLARDVLAVQVSTVASESAFSCSGRIVNKFRTRLDPEMVEALVCSKDWGLASKKGNTELFITNYSFNFIFLTYDFTWPCHF